MIADPDVLPTDFVEVVERGPGDRRTGHLRRPQVGDRRQGPGPADVRDDVLDDRLDLLGRELVGDRPARRPADHPQPLLLVEPIDLDDHAVCLVRQPVPVVAPGLGERDDAVDVESGLVVRVDRETERGEPPEGGRLAGDVPRAAFLDELVGPRRQQPLGRDLGVLLAERARPRVARVGIERQARLLALGVDPGELALGHEHLAAGVERRRLGQPGRDRGDRPEVGRDVLAGRPVAPRRALDEPATLVAQGDRQAVDLELRHVAQVGSGLRRGRQAQAAPDPGVKRPQLVVAEGVAERQHRPAMADLVEGHADRAPHPLGRGIRRDQVGMGGLEGDQLAEQRVVLGVGELRRVFLVVEPVGPIDDRRQLGVTRGCGVGGQARGRIDERLVDRQPIGGHPARIRPPPRSLA